MANTSTQFILAALKKGNTALEGNLKGSPDHEDAPRLSFSGPAKSRKSFQDLLLTQCMPKLDADEAMPS